MRPYVILEGPDAGGKSTLAKTFEASGYAVVHTGPPRTLAPYEMYFRTLANLQSRTRSGIDSRPVVFDRFHLGERVYGPVLRDIDRLGPVYHRMLDRVLLGLGALIVYCATSIEKMTADWEERVALGKELLTDKGRYRRLFDLYEEQLDLQEIDWCIHDYMSLSAEDTLAFSESTYVENKGPGIGRWAPGESILLVGEQIARPNITLVDWPFTGVSASSYWLTEQLLNWRVPERRLYWVNAVRPGGVELDADFLEKLQPSKVIALGERASDWCYGAGVRPIEVPHPAFWKRFKYGVPYPLKEHLV